MIITKLRLEQFRSHVNTTVSLIPNTIHVITGNMGTGKSSILDSLEWACSGKCRHTDERGLNGNLTTTGSTEEARVTVYSDSYSFSRTASNKLSVSTNPRASQKTAQSDLEALIACSGERARLSLRSTRFFSMQHNDQKQLLSDILKIEITPGMVSEALVLKSINHPEYPIHDIAMHLAGKDPANLINFQSLYSSAYDERTIINRKIKDLEQSIRLQTDDVSKIPESTEVNHQTLLSHLKSLEHQQNEQNKQLSVREEIFRQIRTESEKLSSRQIAYERHLSSCAASPPTPPPASPDYASEISTLLDSKSQLAEQLASAFRVSAIAKSIERRRENVSSVLSDASAYIETLSAQLQNLESSAPFCSNYPDHRCPGWNAENAAESIINRITQKQEIVEEAEVSLRELDLEWDNACRAEDHLPDVDPQVTIRLIQKEQVENQAALAQAQSEQRKALAAMDAYNRALDVYNKSVDPSIPAKLLAAISESQSRINELNTRLSTFPQPPTATSIQLANQSINKAKHAVEMSSSYLSKSSQLATAKGNLEKAQLNKEAIEIVLEFFSPTGYQAEVVSKALGSFYVILDPILAPFGLTCRYTPALDLTTESHDSKFVIPKYSQLSAGEQITVAFAHQVAFAIMTGFKIVIVDEVERLHQAAQEKLYHLAETMIQEHGLHHVLFMGIGFSEPVPPGQRTVLK